MSKLQNAKQIPLTLAVWLARDTYDYVNDPNYLSATSLLKSLKSLVISARVPEKEKIVDIHDQVPSRIGTAIHDSIEQAWMLNYEKALTALGFADLAHKIRINPINMELESGTIPIYMEQRVTKELDGIKIGGKYDFIFDGTLVDFKSTSTFTYVNKTNNQKYIEQGSIYRWLNPDIITSDVMEIHYIFTDWKPTLADTQRDYPPSRALAVKLPLLSLEDTEALIRRRISAYKTALNQPESMLPACTDEELWRKESVFKYYNDLNKTTRSTKNFDNLNDAQAHAANLRMKHANNGVLEVKGKVIACKYCNAYPICKQKDQYLATGELTSF